MKFGWERGWSLGTVQPRTAHPHTTYDPPRTHSFLPTTGTAAAAGAAALGCTKARPLPWAAAEERAWSGAWREKAVARTTPEAKTRRRQRLGNRAILLVAGAVRYRTVWGMVSQGAVAGLGVA